MTRYRIKIVWRYGSERFSIQKKGFLFWKDSTGGRPFGEKPRSTISQLLTPVSSAQ